MKKLLILSTFLVYTSFYSQYITVATESPQQLASRIINTKCVTTSNETIISGSDYGNANSVGSFAKNTSLFQFFDGVVLTTGSLNSVPGPKNTDPLYKGDGTVTWPSDVDMNGFLGVSPLNFTNSSSLQFDFISQKDFIKFDYIFASNEYGNNQCKPFSDVVLFILTDLTTNLPVNITTTLVTPTNIRKNQFNNSCPDENPNLFGTFIDDANALSAAINFNGSTIPMVASANIIQNHSYRLKIVIADRSDVQYDSAVFIRNYIQTTSPANGILGNDIVACEGTELIINSNVVAPSYIWLKDGESIPASNTPNYTVPAQQASGNHIYSVIYSPSGCNTFDRNFDSVNVTFTAPLITPNPVNITKCISDTSPYSLSSNTQLILSGITPTPIVSYHASQIEAQNNQNPFPTDEYLGPLTTIWTRITQAGNPCPPKIISFTLGTTPTPLITDIGTLSTQTFCNETTSPSMNVFTLSMTNTILNGLSPSIYGVSYHTSQTGADTNTDIIPIAGNLVANFTTGPVFARVFVKASPSCYITTNFNVVISQLQTVDHPTDIVYCGTPGYILPPLTNGSYFPNKYDESIPNSQGTAFPPNHMITIPTGHVGTYEQTVYVSNLVTSANPCTEEWPLKITLIQPSTFNEVSRAECDKFQLPAIQFGDYKDGAGNIITNTLLTETTTVFYDFQSQLYPAPNGQCSVTTSPITITINDSPDIGSDRQNIFTCEASYTLPSLSAYPGANYYTAPQGPDGTGTIINPTIPLTTTTDVWVYAETLYGTQKCFSDDYFKVFFGTIPPISDVNECTYSLPPLVVGNYYSDTGGPSGTGTLLPVGYEVPVSMRIYVYAEPLLGSLCLPAEIYFQVNVTHPLIDNILIPQCGPWELPFLVNGKYYTEAHNIDGTGGGDLLNPGYIVNSNQTIYVYNSNVGSIPFCYIEQKYDFVYNPKPFISVTSDHDECENTYYDLPVLTFGEYYTGSNGTGLLLDTPEKRRIEGPNSQKIYVYKIDSTTGCFSESSVILTFANTLADVPANPIEQWCTSYTLPPLTNGKYYRSLWDPNDPDNTSSTPPAGIEITNLLWTMPDPTQNFYDHTIYVYNSTLDGVRESCPVNNPLQIILYREPNITKPNNVYVCGSSYVLPSLPTGQKYYKESHIAGGTIFTEITGTITENQRVYIYEENNSIIQNSTFKCYDEEYFDIQFFNVDSGNDILGCGSITLPTLTSGNYYYGPNGTIPITNNIINYSPTETYPKTIHIFGLSPFPSGECPSIDNTFTITLSPSPTINPIPLYDSNSSVIDRTFCDTDEINNGVLNIPLTQYDSTLKGSTQTGNEFYVTYHNSLDEALNNLNPITESLSNNPSIYAVVRNQNFTCTSPPLKIEYVVNLLPDPNPQDAYLCVNNITGDAISVAVLSSGLLTGNYFFEWKDSTGEVVGTSNSYATNLAGDYTLTVTDFDPTKGCVSVVKTVSVLKSSIAITGYSITQDFDDNQIITIIPDGYGDNYVYQLDNGLFQESNVFANVSSGNHQIVIRDKNGCGDSDPINVLVLQYPKFFTPNNDGYNDYWNIYDLQELGDPNTKISIFDRQGKLLKQISPFSQGWDGMHNGNPLLADDYWFVVNYIKEGISREFKSHFSMKR